MIVEISIPLEFQGTIIGGLNKRKGIINNTESTGDWCTITAEIPLNNMFGYSTELRSLTQGKGEFSMEYARYAQASGEIAQGLVEQYKKKQVETK